MSGIEAESEPGACAAEVSEPGVLTLLRRIKDGECAPVNLPADSRRSLVEHLTAEGYSLVEIAEILKVSDRTIARDRAMVLRANAVKQDPQLVGQMVGRLIREAETAVQRIRRVTRERDTPAAVKTDAEHRTFLIVRDLVRTLQGLGYLPSATQQIHAELTHRAALPEGEELRLEIERMRSLQSTLLPEREELHAALGTLQDQAHLVLMQQQVQQAEQNLTEDQDDEP